jgi:molybdopterin-guanine dinucleotide biosynthesis protein A
MTHSTRFTRPPQECVNPAAFGVVLAGGRSRRLGREALPHGKPWLVVGGRTLLDHVVTSLQRRVARVIVAVGSAPPGPLAVGCQAVPDSTAGAGPLAALADALRHGTTLEDHPTMAVVVSCDVPLLRPEVVDLLLDHLHRGSARWVVPRVGGHLQVLVSALRLPLLVDIESHLALGRHDPRGLLARLEAVDPGAVTILEQEVVEAADPGLRSFLDVDTPADLETVRKLLEADRA